MMRNQARFDRPARGDRRRSIWRLLFDRPRREVRSPFARRVDGGIGSAAAGRRGGRPRGDGAPPPVVDRQLYEPFSLGRLLGARFPSGASSSRSTLARVPDPRALPVLEELATDSDPLVRRAAAFAAGRLLVKESLTILEVFLLDGDDEVGAWAGHGLARAGAPLDRVVARLGALPRARRQARLLPDLHSSPRAWANHVRSDRGRRADRGRCGLRRRALLALVASARPPQRPVFARLLGDGDAVVRAWRRPAWARRDGRRSRGAARGQRRRRSRRGDRGRRGGAAIARAGRAAPPGDWRADAARTARRSPPAVRAAAIDAAAAWLLDPELEAALALAARGGRAGGARPCSGRFGGRTSSPPATSRSRRRRDPEPWVRAAAARAAGSLEAIELLDRLASDDSPPVREAAFAARADSRRDREPDLYTRYLADPRAGRARRCSIVSPAPRWCRSRSSSTPSPRTSAPRPSSRWRGWPRLRARAESAPTERGSIVAALEGLTEVGTYPVGSPPPTRWWRSAAASRRRHRDHRAHAERLPQHGGADSWPRWVRIETAAATPSCASTGRGSAPVDRVPQARGAGLLRRHPGVSRPPRAPPRGGRPRRRRPGWPWLHAARRAQPAAPRPGAFGLVRPAPQAAGSRFFVQLGPDATGEGEVTQLGRVVSGLDVLAGCSRATASYACARTRLPLS